MMGGAQKYIIGRINITHHDASRFFQLYKTYVIGRNFQILVENS